MKLSDPVKQHAEHKVDKKKLILDCRFKVESSGKAAESSDVSEEMGTAICNQGLVGLAKFFTDSIVEEREYAEKLIEYQNMRCNDHLNLTILRREMLCML